MGLDMYAKTTSEEITQPVDFVVHHASELHYWRKHPNLHGWLENLYYSKGGSAEFNCVPVLLTLHDLDRLQAAIEQDQLPETTGFFFGASDGAEKADDLQFVDNARKAIQSGLSVFYDSWW